MGLASDERIGQSAPQLLKLSTFSGRRKAKTWEVVLDDIEHGSIQLHSPHDLTPGENVRVEGNLEGPGYSLRLMAQARVVYSRRSSSREPSYHVGAKLLEVGYGPVSG